MMASFPFQAVMPVPPSSSFNGTPTSWRTPNHYIVPKFPDNSSDTFSEYLPSNFIDNISDTSPYNITTFVDDLSRILPPAGLARHYLTDPGSKEAPGTTASSPQAVLILSLLFFIIGSIGLAGNIMIVTAIARDRKLRRSPTNLYIINLAIGDFCVILFAIPEIIIFMMNQGWLLGLELCKFNRFIEVWSLYSSIFTLMTISIERYVAIVHPITARIACSRQKTLLAIALIWAVSAICGLPTLIFNTVVTHPIQQVPLCRIMIPGENGVGEKAFRISESMIFFFLPVCLQFGLYTVIVRKLFARSTVLQAQIEIELGRYGSCRRDRNGGRGRAGKIEEGRVEGPNGRENETTSAGLMGKDSAVTGVAETKRVGNGCSNPVNLTLCDNCNRPQRNSDDKNCVDVNSYTCKNNELFSSNSHTSNNYFCMPNICRRCCGIDRVRHGSQLSDSQDDGEYRTSCDSDSIGHYQDNEPFVSRIWNKLFHSRDSIDNFHRSPTQEALRSRQGVIKMLVATVMVYVISYAPVQIPTFYNLTASEPFQVSWTFIVMVLILTYINSAVNPLLYAIFSENFRHHFKKLLLCTKTPDHSRDPLRPDVIAANRLLVRQLEEGASSTRNGVIRDYRGHGSSRRTYLEDEELTEPETCLLNRSSSKKSTKSTHSSTRSSKNPTRRSLEVPTESAGRLQSSTLVDFNKEHGDNSGDIDCSETVVPSADLGRNSFAQKAVRWADDIE